MSRASTCHDNENKWTVTTSSSYSCPYMPWTVSSDVGKDALQDYQVVDDVQTSCNKVTFDTSHFFDMRAGLVAASFCDALQLLTQVCSMFKNSIEGAYSDQDKAGLELQDDLWVNMPPRSTRKVILRARYAGRGKPLAYLDPLPED